MAELLRVVDLTKQFPVTGTRLVLTAVNGVSFAIEEGETLGLVGESGSGKTTLGRCILRLLEPTRGKILFLGKDIVTLSPSDLRRLRAQMQIVYQNPWEAFNPRMTIGQLIEEPLRLHRRLTGRERQREVLRLADMVGLPAATLKARPLGLPAGQQQRAAIGRAVATKPKLIVLDEATSSLDLSVRLQIIELLMNLQKEFGVSYIFISHDLTSVVSISHRIAIMYLGQILEMGPTDAIFRGSQQPYSRALLSSVMPPDPWASKRRLRLAGEIPSPINLPSGCPLASRCPLVEERCRTISPPETAIEGGDGWLAACHPMAEVSRDAWEKRLADAET
jgi:oligopeptide/dipeptide ABC transporter ATP-binding protein